MITHSIADVEHSFATDGDVSRIPPTLPTNMRERALAPSSVRAIAGAASATSPGAASTSSRSRHTHSTRNTTQRDVDARAQLIEEILSRAREGDFNSAPEYDLKSERKPRVGISLPLVPYTRSPSPSL